MGSRKNSIGAGCGAVNFEEATDGEGPNGLTSEEVSYIRCFGGSVGSRHFLRGTDYNSYC
jgi:hypothetical protein